MFFAAAAGGAGGAGSEPWVTDGTATGTRMLTDVRPGTAGSVPGSFAAIGQTVYFSADDGTNGREIWKTDGTADGTVLAVETEAGGTSSGFTRLVPATDKPFLTHASGELWVSDGSSQGTVPLGALGGGGSLRGQFPRLLWPYSGCWRGA